MPADRHLGPPCDDGCGNPFQLHTGECMVRYAAWQRQMREEAAERLRRRREVEEAEPYNRGICRYCQASLAEPHYDDCEWVAGQ